MAAQKRLKLSNEQVQSIARALADPRRFAILQQIAGQEALPCSALAEHGEITPATISHHLKELTEAGLLDMVRDGRTARLSLRRETWNAYVERLGQI